MTKRKFDFTLPTNSLDELFSLAGGAGRCKTGTGTGYSIK